ncbi:pectin lyase-like protein [Xylaria intraflava]|nr:pectin lyase-like protein [Xylaria intraflava]
MLFKLVVTVASLLMPAVCGEVVRYPRPPIYQKSAYFGLKVDGTDMYTVSYADYDYVQLSMDEIQDAPKEFRIRLLDLKPMPSYSITPQKLPINATTDGNELVFSVKDAHYLIVKIDGYKEFVILADPLETDVPSPDGKDVYNVANYNTDNTGNSVTKGIQEAMDDAAKCPGSIVYVPPGLYSIGNLLLRNYTSLYLAGGSVLRFTGNSSDYKTLFTKSDLFPGTWWIQTEFDSTNITVYGRGTIDGNGFNSRKNKFMADVLVPAGTKNFRSDGILIRDASFWAVPVVQSDEVTFTNLKIMNRFDVTQDDGVDVCESSKVRVRRAIGIGADDPFSTKTWPADTGTTVPYPYPPRSLDNVFFDDCVAWSNTYGYKIGQGVYQSQDIITFQNSVVYTAAVGMGIDHRYGTAMVSNVTFKDMDIEGLHGNAWGQSGWITVYVHDVGAGVGPIEGVYVKNVRARNVGSPGPWIAGWGSAKVSRVTFSDVRIKDSTTFATTLEQMKIVNTTYSADIKIAN